MLIQFYVSITRNLYLRAMEKLSNMKKSKSTNMIDNNQMRIIEFINEHFLMTICTIQREENANTEPCVKLWSANCFYVPVLREGQMPLLYFMSSEQSIHSRNILVSSEVSGTIATQTMEIIEIEGVQFNANVKKVNESDLNYSIALDAYQARFAVAKVMKQTLWELEFMKIKHTRNKPSFGVKTYWSFSEE